MLISFIKLTFSPHMKTHHTTSLILGFAALALVALGFFVVRPVLAQVVASSTELLLGTTTPADAVDIASASTTEVSTAEPLISPESAVLGTSTSTEESPASSEPNALVAEESSSMAESSSSVESPAAESASASSLVEVQLECPMSYTGPLYDTPSGHLDEGYFLGEAAASTTGMTVAREIGAQAWTVCRDDEGNTYEFKITQEEYDSYKIRGTPKKSVMKPATTPAPAGSAATESTTTSAASTKPDTSAPEVLGASTSTTETSSPPAMPTPTESASTSTPQSDAQPPTAQSTSTPLE